MAVSAPRTYGRLDLEPGGQSWVATAVEPHVVIKLKKNFGHIHEAQGDRFRFRNTPHLCTDLDWFMNRFPLRISPGDLRALKAGRRAYERGQVELERILSPDWRPPAYLGVRPGEQVRPYQAQAVETTVRTGRLLLGDDVGLGKTYTAIALMLQAGMLPAAVVVEPHLAKQWKAKIEAFSTLRVHVVEKASAYSLPDADVYLFKYSNVRGWTTFFMGGMFKCVVYDEIQNLRTGRESSKGMACTVLSRHASTILGMSATPIFGMGIEMHAIMGFLAPDDHPLGSKEDFQREWCTGTDGRVKDPKALGTHLRERHLLLRRTKGDVGQQMDRINTVVEEVPYDLNEEKAFEDLTKTLAIRTLSAAVPFERGRAARELDLLMRQVTGVAKAASSGCCWRPRTATSSSWAGTGASTRSG
jgi:SNF2 family DNA or RNA helicase